MKVAVYLSGIPKRSKNEFKKMILRSWHDGVRAIGDKVVLVEDNRIVNCDIAVIQGYVHEHSRQSPHLLIRKNAIDHQRQQGKHSLIIDSNLYQFLNPNDINKYLRYGLDGIFANDAWYFNKNHDLSRWDKIKQSYGFKERDYHTGTDVLVCLQRSGGWSMAGEDVLNWITKTINVVRANTDRPIVVRGHPGNLETIQQFDNTRWHNVTKQNPKEVDLKTQLERTHATVTYNSSPGVASLLYGVPVFVTDPQPERSQVFPYCNNDLTHIEIPTKHDRQEFYHKLAQCHWTTAEVQSGEAYRFMRKRLPNS